MTREIQILLVEDDPVWRTMLTKFINNEENLQVTHTAGTKEEALSFCACNKFDIVLMDINLTHSNLDGIQAILELSLTENQAKIIALTSLEDEKVIIDTFTAGAIHYVSKHDFRKIPDTIRGVMASRSPQEIILNEYLRLKKDEQYGKLTAAEQQIVALSEKGAGRAQIKDKLGKSEGTLKNQITSILHKFKARTMKDAVRTIKSRGLSHKDFER
ncbi:response regulator transcription factor [Paenibacillus sp. HB172176]|uniref:response regulator transcription factor n=1 Tax=Paenibacillus sp. HB172176 TaxID=2493690 RepID=UPI00143C5BEE|nr:response regulator transcription factor [Paenibacillus sp. HB172176]